MKKVYILQTGSYNKTTDRFEFYDVEVFSSKKKLEASVENRMVDCNKGYDILRENHDYGTSDLVYTMIDYKTLSTEGTEMKVRYLLKVKQLQ
jgi:hypothetical protein